MVLRGNFDGISGGVRILILHVYLFLNGGEFQSLEICIVLLSSVKGYHMLTVFWISFLKFTMSPS
jgi:hypothetical protein